MGVVVVVGGQVPSKEGRRKEESKRSSEEEVEAEAISSFQQTSCRERKDGRGIRGIRG